MLSETAFTFSCRTAELIGILHPGAAARGVLVVVGGPQYRVGSHRQFLLLARALAAAGIPVLRFDCRGMGDAGGEAPGFESLDEDIAAALDAFFTRSPGLREVVLWGLCDAASAALFYAWRDSRVTGLVLLNPWVRTEAGEAKAYLRHYYGARLRDPEFWAKLWRRPWEGTAALGSLLGLAAKALGRHRPAAAEPPLPERMAQGLARFTGPVLLILSGNDLTAAEFQDTARACPTWRRLLAQARVTRRDLAEATHTFSRRDWRDQVTQWTLAWLKSW